MVTLKKSVSVEKTVYVDCDVDVEICLDDLSNTERAELLGVASGGPTITDLHAAFLRGQDAVVAIARDMVYAGLGRIV